jgi:hypothetical protein
MNACSAVSILAVVLKDISSVGEAYWIGERDWFLKCVECRQKILAVGSVRLQGRL